MHMFFAVAPFRFVTPDSSIPPATTSIVTMPEQYVAGVELILCSAIVLLIAFALQTVRPRR